jgi:hypothetical protein
VDGLSRWAGLFGGGFRGVLVFTYHVLPFIELPGRRDCGRGAAAAICCA